MRTSNLLLLASSCLLASLACGGRVDASIPDGGAPVVPTPTPVTPTGFATAVHEPLPAVGSTGGKTLAHPIVVPVYFPDDGHRIDLDGFFALLPGSDYWKRTTSEYGVGDVTVGAPIVSTEALPSQMTNDELKTWLASRFEGGAPGWPWTAEPSTIYALFLPESTTLTGEMGQSCKDFAAYHGELHQGLAHTVFAVLPRCVVDGTTVVDELTRSATHELIEAATDPFTDSHRAYWTTDYDHVAWSLLTFGEIGDMCELEPQAYPRLLGAFSVARGWSNQAAAAGHDPCGPGPAGEIYFNASPVLRDPVAVKALGTTITTQGVVVPKGQSRTVDVELFSDAETDGWTLEAVDASRFTGGASELTFQWDQASGNNGDVRKLTIARVADGSGGGTTFAVISRKGPETAHLWFGYAGN